MDYSRAVKNWLLSCPEIKADRLYYNYLSVGAEKQSFQTVEHTTVREDITGNEIGQFNFAIIDFRPLSRRPLSDSDCDLERMADVEKINDWIREQRRQHNYPVLPGATVEDISAAPSPVLAGTDTSEGMNLAKYMIQVRINYLKFND